MNTRQSLIPAMGMPRYGDELPKDVFYVWKKKETEKEPKKNARALRSFSYAQYGPSTHRIAMEWARNNLGPDCFTIASWTNLGEWHEII